MIKYDKILLEKCMSCGFTYGSHHGGLPPWCPIGENTMRWNKDSTWVSSRKLFEKLVKEWCEHNSLGGSFISFDHPSYQEIIKHGEIFLPYIFELIQEKPGWFSYALEKITGANPTTDDMAGDCVMQCNAWLKWAEENNIKF